MVESVANLRKRAPGKHVRYGFAINQAYHDTCGWVFLNSLLGQDTGRCMGKKSREKRERRERADARNAVASLLKQAQEFPGSSGQQEEVDLHFQRDVAAVEAVLRKYVRFDAAVALAVSDLWPPNVASPVKHVFAWAVLLGLQSDSNDAQSIQTHEDFASFLRELYAAWPKFPTLEDCPIEPDWGHVRVHLGDSYVPMFYGSCVERLPDFVEAFRITHAGNQEALADMDFAVALHADLIAAVPGTAGAALPEPNPGHVEVPPEGFWASCRAALLSTGTRVDQWRANASTELVASVGAYKAPLTWASFGDAALTGRALPFLGVAQGEAWVPVSLRSGPGVIIDRWAEAEPPSITAQTHKAVGRYVADRLRHVVVGPMKLMVSRQEFPGLTVSCTTTGGSKVHLFCTCDHLSFEAAGAEASAAYAALRRGGVLNLRMDDGRGLAFGRGEQVGPGADDVQIVIVLTQSGTGFNMLYAPKRPTRVMPLADLVSIFDGLEDMRELEQFWSFADAQREILSPFSSALADLFGTFKDTHGVLVEGAINPTMVALDPHWGSGWRFRSLTEFWASAPARFPDGSPGWYVKRSTNGVMELRSRHHAAMAYSTQVGSCTVQATVTMEPGLEVEDAKMADMFAQMVIDALHECADDFQSEALFQRQQLVLTCRIADEGRVDHEQFEAPLENFEKVVLSASADAGSPTRVGLNLHSTAILAGLNGALNASFEARCLREALVACTASLDTAAPQNLEARLVALDARPSRYHLQVIERTIDVPDFADPVVPTPTEYKLARKALAVVMKESEFEPGRYELQEAKVRIDAARERFRLHLEKRLAPLSREMLAKACVEQHDGLLLARRIRETRVHQSRVHQVDYDRLEALSEARKEFESTARNYRYLLEKTVNSTTSGQEQITPRLLRELIGLVDWYMVLAGASDVLHNQVDVGGVDINDQFVPEVFYSETWREREEGYAHELARIRLGDGIKNADSVEGAAAELLVSKELQKAARTDVGFELQKLLQALTVLAQPVRHGLADELALFYLAEPDRLAHAIVQGFEGIAPAEAAAIVSFLTLSGPDIKRLPGKAIDESDVPFWEHSKRIHRYTIRPLVPVGKQVVWGAEHASRSQLIWLSAVRDGVLPADFRWPNVQAVVRSIKKSIEDALEDRAEEILKRHTPYVEGGVDFFRRFRKEGFADVGDYDVLAYWPAKNTVLYAECKYNQTAHSIKDSRRLRDRMFGMSDVDRDGQYSRIHDRRAFLTKNRNRIFELLKWPKPAQVPPRDVEVYVSRELHYWMVHPPYEVPTKFIRVDALDAWVNNGMRLEKH